MGLIDRHFRHHLSFFVVRKGKLRNVNVGSRVVFQVAEVAWCKQALSTRKVEGAVSILLLSWAPGEELARLKQFIGGVARLGQTGQIGRLCELHPHREAHNAALVFALRVQTDVSAVRLHQVRADYEARSRTLEVEVLLRLDEAETVDQLALVLFPEPSAVVDDGDAERALFFGEGRYNKDLAARRLLEPILAEVDEDLGQAELVAHQWTGQFLLLVENLIHEAAELVAVFQRLVGRLIQVHVVDDRALGLRLRFEHFGDGDKHLADVELADLERQL